MTNPLGAVRRSLFLISMPMVFISFALPLRAEDLGASKFEVGVLFSLFTASLFVLRPFVGFGMDRFGRRPFFLAALVFYLFANALYAFSDTLGSFYVARLMQGIAFAFLSITTDTITADLTQVDERPQAMGANIANQSRGGMVGAVIGFSLVGAIPLHAWSYSFASFAAVALLAVIFAFRAIPETLEDHGHAPAGFRLSFPGELNRLLVPVFLMAFAASLIQPFTMIFLRDRYDAELSTLAFAFLPVGLVYAILPSWLGKLTRNWHRARAMGAGLAFAGGLYLAVPHVEAFVLVIALFTGGAIGSVLADLTRNAWIGDISDGKATGQAYGIAALAAGIGSTLGPLAGGAIYEGWGQDYLFYTSGLILLATTCLTLFSVARD